MLYDAQAHLPPLEPPLEPPLPPDPPRPPLASRMTCLTGTTTLLLLSFSRTSFSEMSPFFIFFWAFLIVLESFFINCSPNSL